MVQARKPGRLRPRAKTLLQSLGEFLTPEVWKQVRKAVARRKMPRWDVGPLLLVLLAMTWCCGESLPEKFEAARGFYVICHDKRRRPGAGLLLAGSGPEETSPPGPSPPLVRAGQEAEGGRLAADRPDFLPAIVAL